MVHPYLNRRAGREPVTYPHPSLEPILRRTLGVPLFQEQLLRMAMAVAGFTGGEAEELRRAMGFKRSEERMQEIEARLRRGMARNGHHRRARRRRSCASITSFALYGFPESHAASFALHRLRLGLPASAPPGRVHLRHAQRLADGLLPPATLVKDAQRHGVRVLPIDVTRSGWKCSLEKGVTLLGGYAVRGPSSPPLTANTLTPNPLAPGVTLLRGYAVKGSSSPPSLTPNPLTPNTLAPNTLSLRLGLRYVAGLREAAGRRIEEERAKAPFASIDDLAIRCELRDGELQTLAHIGAFAAFGLTRREALWQAAAVPKEPLFKRRGLRG